LKTPGTAARIVGVVLGVFASLFVVGAIGFMYVLVTVWYFIVLGLFGILTFPWRLHRRSQRRTQHLAEAQLAAAQALLIQQQRRW
jgi:Flp pilus assembly protein TadB